MFSDPGVIVLIIITVILHVVAIFVKGFTFELMPEAGVSILSIKLIKMSYRNCLNYIYINNELNESNQLLKIK